ncbi:hypothetical protein [Streptomyces sp. NPDC055287]
MKHLIRPAGAALAAFAFLTGTAACTTPQAPAPQPTASAPPSPPRPPRLPSEQQLTAAAAALTDQNVLDDEGTFVLSTADGLDSASQSEIDRGTHLLIEAACAGEGSATLTVTSGRAKTRQHLACAEKPRAKTFAFTTRGGSVFFEAGRGTATSGALAYLARRPASEHR